jgi:hypothetical protein
MERREGMQPQYIQIEGPVSLEAGQNFYDQPPFNIVLSKVAERYDVDQSALQAKVTKHAMKTSQASPEEKSKLLQDIKAKVTYEHLRKSTANGKVYEYRSTKTDKELHSLNDAVLALEMFPQWDTYISEKMLKHMYKKDGSFSQVTHSKDQSKTPSYGSWFENRMARNARLQKVAVRSVLIDTFPQDLQQKSVSDAIASTGVKPPRKRWQILKASPTTPTS